jgi:predicted transcriptional regulator of viral defense system
MTPAQKKLVTLAQRQDGCLTKKQADEEIGAKYYCNAEKHVGDVLSRMVNSGILLRLAPGKFVINVSRRAPLGLKKELNPAPAQPTLFE